MFEASFVLDSSSFLRHGSCFFLFFFIKVICCIILLFWISLALFFLSGEGFVFPSQPTPPGPRGCVTWWMTCFFSLLCTFFILLSSHFAFAVQVFWFWHKYMLWLGNYTVHPLYLIKPRGRFIWNRTFFSGGGNLGEIVSKRMHEQIYFFPIIAWKRHHVASVKGIVLGNLLLGENSRRWSTTASCESRRYEVSDLQKLGTEKQLAQLCAEFLLFYCCVDETNNM